MRKAFTYILIFFALSVSAQMEYKPKVSWKTVVDSVGYISPNTYIVKVDPIDYNDPGAIQRIVSGYLMDNIGHVYMVIDSTSTTITVTDDFGYGISPVAGKKGWVFQSVGNGTAPYIAPVMYEPLDSKAKDNADKLFKDILWREANLYAQDSAKIQFDADTLTWDATKYDLDTLSFLRNESDPVYVADSARLASKTWVISQLSGETSNYHIEAARLDNLTSRSVSVIFPESFNNKPVGEEPQIYRLENFKGSYRRENLLWGWADLNQPTNTGFSLNIDSSESLGNVLLEYIYVEILREWILSGGIWADKGRWIDEELWID